MADKPDIRSDRDSLHGHLLDEQETVDPKGKELSALYGNKYPAQSMWSTGRNCPKCAGQLATFELSEDKQTLWVYCKTCQTKYSHQDLDTDELYRQIPNDMVLRYVADMKRKGK